ncbi:hypothetical protein CT846_24180 [Salmonella enterica]|nr:hypothetical protein [Salmonella enterica]
MTPHILCLAFPSPPRMFHTIKRRFAYSVCVVNFRKYCYSGKIGSPGNRRPVIRFRFYKPGCNCIWLKL